MHIRELNRYIFIESIIELIDQVIFQCAYHKSAVFLLRYAHVEADVRLAHDVPGPRVEQDRVFVEFGQLRRPHAHQRHTESHGRKEVGFGIDRPTTYIDLR